MARRLAYTVHIDGPDGQPVAFGPDDEVPAWAKDKIGDHAYVQAEDAEIPPRSGKGSGQAAWSAYASSQGVEIDEDASKDDIIAALEQAGKPVE